MNLDFFPVVRQDEDYFMVNERIQGMEINCYHDNSFIYDCLLEFYWKHRPGHCGVL